MESLQTEPHLPPTPRQIEILALCAQGNTCEQIGRILFLSPYTIKQQMQLAKRRLGAQSLPHAVALCLARGHLVIDEAEEATPEPHLLVAA